MNEIVLTQDIIDSFLQHGEKDYPFECCGFILGHFIDEKSVGTEYIAALNTKEEKTIIKVIVYGPNYSSSLLFICEKTK